MSESKTYTRYIVRDRDGEVVQQGRIYPLCRALDLDLVGKDKSRIRCGGSAVIRGPYVFHPDIKDVPLIQVEVF